VKRTSVIAAVLTLGLTLGACGGDEEEPAETTAGGGVTSEDSGTSEDTAEDTSEDTADDSMTSTGDMSGETAGAGSFADPACEEFFTEGGPLADRAEAARTAIENGEIVDAITYGEVSLLEARIAGAAEEAPEEIASLLEAVNAPFTEAVDAVNAGALDAETGVVTLPEIDVQASADAQTELETACEG